MGFYFAKPSTILSPFVKQYWGLENCMSSGEEHLQRIVPNGLMELTFYLGDLPKLINHHQSAIENTIISGHCKGPYDLVVKGNLLMFSVSFKPLGASMFFNLPMNELFGCIVPARFLLKESIDCLETSLSETSDFTNKVRLVEEFLMKQLTKKENVFGQKRLKDSLDLINKSKGIVGVNTLASSACWSRKQYERNFQEIVGTSPKQVMRIGRFQQAIHFKGQHPQAKLAGLAYDCGFSDQSHMINEFKDLSGRTPKQYFSECDPFSDYFSE
jgi:AraC-like DNA-binding protein